MTIKLQSCKTLQLAREVERDVAKHESIDKGRKSASKRIRYMERLAAWGSANV